MASGTGLSNRGVIDNLNTKLGYKYYWLYLGILVYNDIGGRWDHWITGSYYVNVFHEHDKNVVVFYRSTQHIPQKFNVKSLNRFEDLLNASNKEPARGRPDYPCSQAEYCSIRLSESTPSTGLAVIKRGSGLLYSIDDGLKSYDHNGYYMTGIIFP
jgi:hypothetical protein